MSVALPPASLALSPSRAALRPSDVSKSAATALTSAFAVASVFVATSALPVAKLSLSMPNRPLGSAALTAIPAIIGLSSSRVHSSGVKLALSAMPVSPSRMSLPDQ